MEFTIFHKDHGINDDQWAFVRLEIMSRLYKGFIGMNSETFKLSLEIPNYLGTVPCGLHGPAMMDDPVLDSEVTMKARGDREWKDRLIDRPTREVKYVQVIGTRDPESDEVLIFTCYGGPLAPQNPDDPHNVDPDAARAFWSEHALSM